MSIIVYPSLPDSVEHAILVMANSTTSPKTAAVYESTARQFLSWWRNHPQFSSPASAMDAWKQELLQSGLKFSSINVKLSAVRKLFDIMARERVIDANDLAGIKQVKNFPQRGSRVGCWLNDDEMRRLLSLPDRTTVKGKRDYALLAVALACGLRAFELSMLTWEHIQKVGEVWAIVNLQGKHGRVRTVPIAPYAMSALQEYRKHCRGGGKVFRPVRRYDKIGKGGLSRQAIYGIVKEYGARLGKEISPHDLRRSAAKRLANRAGMQQAKELLGHSSVVITERYLDTAIDLELVGEAMELFDDASA